MRSDTISMEAEIAELTAEVERLRAEVTRLSSLDYADSLVDAKHDALEEVERLRTEVQRSHDQLDKADARIFDLAKQNAAMQAREAQTCPCADNALGEVTRLRAENARLTADWAREHTHCEFAEADRALGAMVRKMPFGYHLLHDVLGSWFYCYLVKGGTFALPYTTPEEAIQRGR